MRSEEEILRELRGWILGKAGDLDEASLTGDTALFEERHLRSVHLPELLLLLERLTGTLIDVDDLRPGDFRDLNTMMDRLHAGRRA